MNPSTARTVDLRGHAAEIARAAGRAPSLHNAQPWRLRIGPAEVEVWADRSRRVPLADPEDRQLFIGLGAAVFGVRLALHHLGRRCVVQLTRDPAQPDLAAVVAATGVLAAGASGTVEERLYAELDRRRTVRDPFTDDAVPVPLQAALTELVHLDGAALQWVVREAARSSLAALIMAAELAQQSDPDFRAELDRWVGPAATGAGAGIPATSVGTTLSSGRLAEFPLRDFAAGRPGMPLPTDRPEAHPGIVALSTPTDLRADWLRAGQAMQHLLLAASAAGYAASFLNQPLEFPGLRSQVREELRLDGHPQLLLRLGRPAGPLPPPTPRRPVQDILIGS